MQISKNFELGLYEKSMPPGLPWKERFCAAKKAGFDFIEISVDETDEKLARLQWNRAEKDAFLSQSRDCGFPVKSMCLSGHRRFPLGSSVKEIEERAVEIMKTAILFADDLGIRIIQLAGYDVYYNEKSNLETKERFMDNLYQSTLLAAKYGVILGLETMENDFMNTVEKAMYYVSEINSPYLQVYPDVGNVNNATSNATFDLRRGKGHIAAVHLKETREGIFRDLKFGEGSVDFNTIVRVLKAQGVRLFTAEFWWNGKNGWENDLKNAHDYLTKCLMK
jgi:L-ribulose-5-phosphate 3-epimerase